MRTRNHTTDSTGGRPLGRRRLLQGALAAGGLALAGAGAAQTVQAQEVGALAAHPGMLHTQADLDRMASRIAAGAQPWLNGWNKLIANSHASSGWNPNPQATIVRGGGVGENYGILYNDIAAAYQNALRYRLSGSIPHRDKAVQICNAWSSTLQEITGSADRWLAAGIYGYQFCNAAELLRGVSTFDMGRFQNMMRNVFLPMNRHFLEVHNGACITNYWSNWDLCTMDSMLSIGVLCDDGALVNEAIDYFWNGEGNGSIDNAIPFVYDQYAQMQEFGRDQGHCLLSIGLMSTFMETAWNQGVDLYSARGNAFAKACEAVARYNLGYDDVPWTNYSWGSGVNCAYNEHTSISSSSRGQGRPIWELVYNHYVVRQGLQMPNTARIAAAVRVEGGGGDYGSTSGGYDHLGFGTLTAMRQTAAVVSGGVYTFMCERSGKALDNGSSTAEGAQAMQWTYNGSAAPQRWRVTDVGGGYHKLVSLHSGKALDNGSTTGDGGVLVQWTDTGAAQQRWRITDVGGGAVKLVCQHSGRAIDNGNREANGDRALQWTDTGGVPQRWQLRRVA
ncbi:RICIN domain-containing protein [Glycomyces sp. MUSA5-2]|uniref:RICIN domain-containing protein n=1 Tax=Glycomyces sp. MUSA5-2 TaxID=2053002 RepID=UPI00300A61BA